MLERCALVHQEVVSVLAHVSDCLKRLRVAHLEVKNRDLTLIVAGKVSTTESLQCVGTKAVGS